MIFRKPYAFLIKYFKLINIILAALTSYILYRSYNIVNFFNDYVVNNYSGNYYEGFYASYISPIMFIIIVLIIFGVSSILLLLVNRKKPIKAYVATIIYYVLLIIFLNIVKNIMISLVEEVISAETARIYRDISLIVTAPQVVFIVLFLLRGSGFNLKKFDSEKDIKEFEILAQDNEEFEFTFKNDGVKAKRTIHRFFREFVYYVKENKFMFIIITVILVIVASYSIYKSFPEIIDRNYKQGDSFYNGIFKVSITDSIITNLDYNGNVISDDNYYLVAKLIVENTSGDNVTIDYNIFRLEAKNEYIYPSGDQSNYFIDYANNCHVGVIKSKSSQICTLVYKIDIKQSIKNYKIKIQNGNVYNNGTSRAKYNYVILTPVVIDKIVNEATIDEGKYINLQNSNLGNTLILFENFIITNKYEYKYEYCTINNECKEFKNIVSIDLFKNKSLLVVASIDYKLDSNTEIYKYSGDINQIIASFAKIKYIKNDKINYLDIKNVTPPTLNGKIVLETSNIISDADELYIALIVRNKEYLVKIK